MQRPWQSLFVLTRNPISKLTLYGIRALFPVKTTTHKTYTGVWWRENGLLITVAIGSTIEMKLAQLTLHAPSAIIKDCKQMPKRPHFLFLEHMVRCLTWTFDVQWRVCYTQEPWALQHWLQHRKRPWSPMQSHPKRAGFHFSFTKTTPTCKFKDYI